MLWRISPRMACARSAPYAASICASYSGMAEYGEWMEKFTPV